MRSLVAFASGVATGGVAWFPFLSPDVPPVLWFMCTALLICAEAWLSVVASWDLTFVHAFVVGFVFTLALLDLLNSICQYCAKNQRRALNPGSGETAENGTQSRTAETDEAVDEDDGDSGDGEGNDNGEAVFVDRGTGNNGRHEAPVPVDEQKTPRRSLRARKAKINPDSVG